MWVVEDDICTNSEQMMMMMWRMIVKMMFAQQCIADVGSRG